MGSIKAGFPINSLDIMKRTTGTCFLTGALLSLATDALAQGNDSITRKWVDGNFYTEANYGYNFFGDKRDTYDFPHAVVDLNIHLGKGWHLSTEQEFEYLTENGDWPKHFSDEYSVNWAYVKKDFSPKLSVMAGILNIPLGLISSYYNTGLTVYDPLSENRVLPMKWHETAIAVTGKMGKISYWLGYLCHLDGDVKDYENHGGAARIDWYPNNALRLGVSGFIGEGEFLGDESGAEKWCDYADIDYNYDHGKWISSGEVVYQSESNNISIGAEVGYRVTNWLLPFARYDLLTIAHEKNYKVSTVGLNAGPFHGVGIKLQLSQEGGNTRFDSSLAYSLSF